MRIRITPIYKDETSIDYLDVKAEIRSIGKSGILDTSYLPKGKYDEMVEYGFAYTNQPKERVV